MRIANDSKSELAKIINNRRRKNYVGINWLFRKVVVALILWKFNNLIFMKNGCSI